MINFLITPIKPYPYFLFFSLPPISPAAANPTLCSSHTLFLFPLLSPTFSYPSTTTTHNIFSSSAMAKVLCHSPSLREKTSTTAANTRARPDLILLPFILCDAKVPAARRRTDHRRHMTFSCLG